MSFVYPGFLWALLLLAVPIIIHLFHFRRYRKVLFPNVKFLQNVQKQTQSVKKVRNLLVLLARLLAVSFLVFAFAQPYIPVNNSRNTGDQVVALYIDNSFSMENEGQNGPLFEEAKEKARKLVRAYNSSDRFIIGSNSYTGRHPVSQDDAIAEIDAIEIEKTSKPLTNIMASLKTSLQTNGQNNRQYYLFSDFQKHNRIMDFGNILDSNDQVSVVFARSEGNNNISIDTAWFESPIIHLNKPINLKAKISNHGDGPVQGGSIFLDVNGERKALGGFDIDAGATVTVDLGFSISEGGWQRAGLHIDDAPILFDDDYFLSFNVQPEINVVIANGNEPNTFLTALFNRDEYFHVSNQQSGNLDLASVKTADLVILNELSSISTGLTSSLAEYVSSGGSLLIIPTAQTTSGDYLKNLTTTLGLPDYGNVIEQKTAVGKIDISNPLFEEVFEKMPDIPDYPKVNKYRRLITDNRSVYNLLSLENQDVFLSSSHLGNGAVYQLSCPLNDSWTNFQRHGLILPIIFKMAVNRSIDYALSHTISNDNIFKTVPETRNRQGELKLKSEQSEWIPVLNASGSSPLIDAGYDQVTAGHLSLFSGDSLLQVVSYNFDRGESESRYYTTEELGISMPGVRLKEVENPTTYVQETVNTLRYGKQFWKWCIILALIFLAIEILLLRFWPDRARKQKIG